MYGTTHLRLELGAELANSLPKRAVDDRLVAGLGRDMDLAEHAHLKRCDEKYRQSKKVYAAYQLVFKVRLSHLRGLVEL